MMPSMMIDDLTYLFSSSLFWGTQGGHHIPDFDPDIIMTHMFASQERERSDQYVD